MPRLLSNTLADALKKATKKGADKGLDALKKKGNNKRITDSYDALSGDAHAKAFTVAKVSQLDLLDDIFKAIEDFKTSGKSVKEFKEQIIPILQKKGWWGKHTIKDPKTGEMKTIQLGSESRLNLILRTNIRVAQSQARFKQQMKASKARPYLFYMQKERNTKRETHAKLDGRIFRADDPEIHRIYPPNGFGCHCRMRSLSERQLKNMNGKVESVGNVLKELKLDKDVKQIDLDEMDRFDPRGTDFEKDMKKYSRELRDQARELLKSKAKYTKRELADAKRSKIMKESIKKTTTDKQKRNAHKNLSEEEKSSLNAITTEKMQEMLKSVGGSSGKILTGYKKVLDTAIDKAVKSPTSRNQYIYKSKSVSPDELNEFKKKYSIDEVIEERNYILASDTLGSGNLVFKYSSKNAVDISDLSETSDNRIIGRNKLFKVVNVEDNEARLIITLEEIL
jgi:SPP1 gp7 family putative phage head morphogenesis protein